MVGDHLGTAQVELSAGDGLRAGAPISKSEFAPFGQEISDSAESLNHYKFTGKERDSESGLDYFGARYAASSAGRFLSPDPVVISRELGNPQSLNKYSYVFNNPLSLVDSDGKWPGWYHEELDRNFFGNQLHMSRHDQDVIVAESYHQDGWGIFQGYRGQASGESRVHGMDDAFNPLGWDGAVAATRLYISNRLDQAVGYQLQNDTGVEVGYGNPDAALQAIGGRFARRSGPN